MRSGGTSATKRNDTGQYLDDTGLLFYNARYYDPAIGRFVSADSVVPGSGPLTTAPHDATARAAWAGGGAGPVSPQHLNRYSYAGNNPVRNTDPTGHFTCFLLCPLGAAAGSVAGPAGTAVGGAVGSAGDALLLAAAALVVAAVLNASEDLNSAGSIPGSVGGAEGLPSAEPQSDYEGPVSPAGTLVRQGKDKESATRLNRKAGEAEAKGFPHGVSVTTPAANHRLADDPSDASTATRGQIEAAGFPVKHTPTRRDPDHHTVVLPKPVTPTDAQRFNQVFGRTRRLE